MLVIRGGLAMKIKLPAVGAAAFLFIALAAPANADIIRYQLDATATFSAFPALGNLRLTR